MSPAVIEIAEEARWPFYVAPESPLQATIRRALEGAQRVLAAELSGRVSYISMSGAWSKMDGEGARARLLTNAVNALSAERDYLRGGKTYSWGRFGSCSVPFDVSSHFGGQA